MSMHKDEEVSPGFGEDLVEFVEYRIRIRPVLTPSDKNPHLKFTTD